MTVDSEKARSEGDPAKTAVCTNHVAGAYWGAPCPNCGKPVSEGNRKDPDPMNNKRNS